MLPIINEVKLLRHDAQPAPDVDKFFNMSVDLLCILTADGFIRKFNPSFEKMLGYTQAEMLAQSFDFFTHADDRSLTSLELGKLARGETSVIFENRIVCKDGKINSISWNMRLEGPLIYCIGSDMTSQKQIEKSQKETDSLYKTKQDEFMSALCHELRNPLNALALSANLCMNNIQTMQKTLKARHSIGDDDAREIVDTCLIELFELNQGQLQCVLSQKEMVDEVLDFSSKDAGELRLVHKAFSPRHVIMSTIQIFAPELKIKNVAMHANLPDEDLLVWGDPQRLKQVITHLLSNAAKFTESGKITISLLVLAISAENSLLRFVVEDTGTISPDEINEVHMPQAQVDRDTTHRVRGSGLVLAICKNIIKRMGGDIETSSEQGKGATFAFTLNFENIHKQKGVLRAGMATGRDPVENALLIVEPLHVLIVDDERINQKLLARILVKRGCICEVADDGVEATNKFRELSFDIIFMDKTMPKMSGVEATRQIRKYETESSLNATMIVGLSGNALESDKQECLQAGMDTYITKPILIPALDELLRICSMKKSMQILSYQRNKNRSLRHASPSLPSLVLLTGKNDGTFKVDDIILPGLPVAEERQNDSIPKTRSDDGFFPIPRTKPILGDQVIQDRKFERKTK